MSDPSGDFKAFERNWATRAETHYLHWIRGEPRNQIQLAFRQHWSLFNELMGPTFKGRRCLEVGCGRGSMSAYFADAGWDCTLADLAPSAIETARAAFAAHGLRARFEVADALKLPYADGAFDCAVSIGLLEHFENVDRVIEEQVRVLDRGGIFLGYVVPKIPDNVQADYHWVNDLIRALVPPELLVKAAQKQAVYRSDALSAPYLEILRRLPLRDIGASGVYPLPMISYSTEFPFTLLDERCERILVDAFSRMLEQRRRDTGKHPWLCDERRGQAFLLWGFKR